MFRKYSKLKTIWSVALSLGLLLGLLSSTGVVQAKSNTLAPLLVAGNTETIPNQYIVVYKAESFAIQSEGAIRSSVAAQGGDVKFVYKRALNGYSAYLPKAALAAVRANPAVAYVEADGIVTVGPVDPKQDEADTEIAETGEADAEIIQPGATWGLDRIDQRNLPRSSSYTYNRDGTGVHVYVIDTGIRSTHNEFGGRASKDFDSINDGQNGNDCNGHGTHVAGTIGGATYGVAKNVTLHGVRVLNCAGSGSWSQVIAGIDWVAANHISPAVANMSLGGNGITTVDTATTNLINSGVVTVVAAGNSNMNACLFSPARTPAAITVGATTSNDSRAYFSNFGNCLDIFAPGLNIASAWNGNDSDLHTISGTSMASPHVAGVAALYLEENPAATVSQVRSVIVNNSTLNKVKTPGTKSPNKLLHSLFLPIPNQSSPLSVTNDTTPTFKWFAVPGATSYRFQVLRSGKTVYTRIVSACADTTCSNTPPKVLTYSNAYRWRIQALVSGIWQAYSVYRNFEVAP